MILPEFQNRVRYTLQHDLSGSQQIQEPIGWKDDDNVFKRNKKYHGVFVEMTNNLEFTGDGKEYVKLVYESYGINAKLRLLKDEKHPKTNEWVRSYDGFLDLSTYEEEGAKVKAKFNASNLFKLIKSREREKIELERLDTLNGNILEPLDLKTVSYKGRRIFLKSLLEVSEEDNKTTSFRMKYSSGNRTAVVPIPTTINYKSDERVHAIFNNQYSSTPNIGEASMLFFAIAEKDRQLKVDIKINSIIKVVSISPPPSAPFFQIVLTKYKNGSSYDNPERTVLWTAPSFNGLNNTVMSVDYSETLNLEAGESLSLQWYGGGNFSGGLGSPNDYIYLNFEDTVASINIEEDSFYEPTQSNVLLPKEGFDRITNVITNQENSFKSDLFNRTDLGAEEDGYASLIGTTSGMWIRGYTSEDELYKPYTTSISDMFEAYDAILPIGMGIEKVGFKEVIVVEKLEHFYNENITIKLGKVSNLKRKVATDFFASSLELGYEKGGDYEEAMGLDEYNTKTTYTTVIEVINKVYKKLSKYRGDSYGAEFARRKPKVDNPTLDTKYDSEIFLKDLKRSSTEVFEERVWQDDFEQEPTGIYSQETATNLRLSPMNNLLRHSWQIVSGLTKYPLDFIKFGSSVANSSLVTKLTGGVEIQENGSLQNNSLGNPKYLPEWIEFEHLVDFELMEKIKGTKIVLGKKIPNVYGRVSFINDYGATETGFLWELKPNGKGKWKILKSYR